MTDDREWRAGPRPFDETLDFDVIPDSRHWKADRESNR